MAASVPEQYQRIYQLVLDNPPEMLCAAGLMHEDEEVKYMAEALRLNQYNNTVHGISNEGCRHLAEVLRNYDSLTGIEISDNRIAGEGWSHVAEVLRGNSSLRELRAMRNPMGKEGCRYLAEALQTNSTLKKLELSRCEIGDEGCAYLAEALQNHPALTTLDLSGNGIGVEGCRCLAEALRSNSVLDFLDLEDNKIGSEGCDFLRKTMETNHTLSAVHIHNNGVSEEVVEEMEMLGTMNEVARNYPLHLACSKFETDVVRTLLENGADLSLVSCHSFMYGTPLNVIVDSCDGELKEGWRGILIALGRAGARYTIREKNPFLLEDYKPPKVWKHLIMLAMVGEDETFKNPAVAKYFEVVSNGAKALPFMKASYSPTRAAPLVGLPPEILERVYMYCTEGRLSVQEVKRLYPAGILVGMEGISEREIVHGAVDVGLEVKLAQ